MKAIKKYSNILELNVAIIFISTSGVLGRYIGLPVPIIIGLRAILAGLLLFLYCRYKGFSLTTSPKDRKAIFIGGALLGIHWVTYFLALKMSNVAVGMMSLFTFPAITAILEPFILKTKLLKSHLFLAVTILVGVYFLVPDFDLENTQLSAVAWGVFSAVCYAFRNIVTKPLAKSYNSSVLMTHQLLVVAVFSLPLFFILDTSNMIEYLPTTLVLAIITTVIGHTLFVYTLQNFSTTSASIISSLMPVYGVLMGVIFLAEYPNLNTIIGGLIIISSVVIESIRVHRLKQGH